MDFGSVSGLGTYQHLILDWISPKCDRSGFCQVVIGRFCNNFTRLQMWLTILGDRMERV